MDGIFSNFDDMEKHRSTQYVDMIITDGFFRMTYHPMKELCVEQAKEIVKERIAFKEGTPYPSLFDVRKVKAITKEARDYMANEGNELVVSSALLINSPVLKMMGNFFITVNRPIKPTQLFTSEDKALEWLNQYKESEVAYS